MSAASGLGEMGFIRGRALCRTAAALSKPTPVGAAEGCDLLIFNDLDDARRSKDRSHR
jgi:hypothetical protein